MSAISWVAGVNGNWRTGGKWSGGVAPTAIDDVTIAAGGAYTVNVTTHDVANSLTFNASGATLAESSSGRLSVTGAVSLQAGVMSLAGANAIGAFSESGGVLQLANAGALGANALTLTGGELSGMTTENIANHLLMSGTGFTIDAAAGQAVDFGGGGWLIDRSQFPLIQFGSSTQTGTVLWHADDGGINGVNSQYTVNIAGGTLKAADGGMGYFLGNAFTTTIQAGATLDINGVSTAITNLFGVGNIINSGGAATLRLSGASFGGDISGSTAIEIVQNTSLEGVNTSTGATFVDSGAVLFFRGTGSVAGVVVDSGEVENQRDIGPLSLGVISGAGLVIQEGGLASVMTLNNADTYTGGTYVDSGTLSIGDGAALGTGLVTLFGGELVATTTLTMGNALTLTNNATLAAAAGTTFTITGGSGLTFDASAGPLSVTFGDAVNTGTVVLTSGFETVYVANPTHLAIAGGTLRAGDNSLSLVAGNAADFTIAAGATLDLGGNNLNTVSLTSSGTITNSSATAATLVMTANNFISGPVTGNLALWAYNGTSILTGADTYTGGTKIYAAATLQLGTGFAAGSIVGNIDDEGLLTVVDDVPVALTGVISGAGSLIDYGSGAITLGGANTYAGGTTLNAGELILGGGNALGTGNVALNGGELLATKTMGLAATQNGANTFSLSGANTIAAVHGATLTLGGAQIQVNAGAINIGEGVNDGTVVFSGGSGAAPGPFTINVNAGTLKTGDFTFGNLTSFATQIDVASGATWNLAGFTGTANSLSGAGVVTNSSGAKAVLFDLGGQFDGVISGKIELSASDATLTGANTYTGGTAVQIGRALTLGAGGTTGSIVGAVADAGTLAIDRSNAVALTNVISGAGSVIQEGTGVTTISGANSYTGGTTVDGGELIVTAAAALGKGGALTVVGAELLATTTAILSHDLEAGGATLAAAHGATLTLAGVNDTIDAGTIVFGEGANDGTIVFKAAGEVGFSDQANTFVEVRAGLVKQGDSGLSGLLGGASGTKIDAGATVDAGGRTLHINSLTGTGSLTNSGAATLLTLFGSTDFAGVISGKFNTIDVFGSATLRGAETFTGTARIDDGSLTLSGTFAETVAFNGGGTLALAAPANFTGAIKGFGDGTFIDLANITSGATAMLSYDTATHTLTVSDGVHSDQLKLVGVYKQGNFIATADGSGGTTIGWQTAPASHLFVQAMAGLGAGGAGATQVATDLAHLHPAPLAVPR